MSDIHEQYKAMLEQHKQVCADEMYQFLRWECRDIYGLLSEGEISVAKAHEAATERKLGREPLLPSYQDLHDLHENSREAAQRVVRLFNEIAALEDHECDDDPDNFKSCAICKEITPKNHEIDQISSTWKLEWARFYLQESTPMVFMCSKCGVIRWQKMEACVCGSVETCNPRAVFQELAKIREQFEAR